MKILPEYLIQYIPEIEEAIEELRLSILDHAYDMLKSLDIDELSSGDVRQKLNLYEISVDNMTSDWLPNGRFYRLYPSIKHHRSRLNTVKAIAKSGGQFESLWSDDFNKKSEFAFKSIQVLRHYDLSSNTDGYFYVSGDTVKSADGKVISSAAQALTTDILINQSLPAGYTYLYMPWPRPTYPGDIGYFYNVHMLDYDRLQYTDDCEHIWVHLIELDDESCKVYYCAENSIYNKFCKVFNDNTIKYRAVENGILTDEYTNEFTESETDIPWYVASEYDCKTPASTKYDWEFGTNTPYKMPYWLDYHYMEDMHKTLPRSDRLSGGTWPIVEHGTYYDNYDDPTIPEEAISYRLDASCEKLGDSRAVFPSRCYYKQQYNTTEPDRKQKFTLGSPTLTIFSIEDNSYDATVKYICKILSLDENEVTSRFNNTLKYKYEKLEDSSNKITIIDSKYADYNSIKLKINYSAEYNNYSIIVEFNNGVWISDITDDISNVIVYSPVEFIINDTIAGQLTNNVNEIRLDNNVTVYNYWYRVTSSFATVNIDERTINLHLTDEDKKKLKYKTDILSESDFYRSGWIIQQKLVNVFYGDEEIELWEDAGIDELENIYSVNGCNYIIDYSHTDSIDEHDCLKPDNILLDEKDEIGNQLRTGPYRFDLLHNGNALHIHESLHHFKEYKPFWCENTLFSEMLQSLGEPVLNLITCGENKIDVIRVVRDNFNIGLKDAKQLCDDAPSELPINLALKPLGEIKTLLEDVGAAVTYTSADNSNSSLYYWFNTKQSENRPSISTIYGEPSNYFCSEDIIKNNCPKVSEVSFTSYCRPTRGKLDKIYIGYFVKNVPEQEENHVFEGQTNLYECDADFESVNISDDYGLIKYDPEYYYTVINLNYNIDGDQEYVVNHIKDSMYSYEDIYAQFIGDPYSKSLKIESVNNINHHTEIVNGVLKPTYNYITFKKSRIHKLWFNQNHENVILNYDVNGSLLYNMRGSSRIYNYSENKVNIIYDVIGIYTANGVKIDDMICDMECMVSDNSYSVIYHHLRPTNYNNIYPTIRAAYILYTVKIIPGNVKKVEYTQIDAEAHYNLGMSVHYHTDLGKFGD